MEKQTTDKRLNLAWHRLLTPFIFELAEVPYTVLASASGAKMSTLMEKNLRKKRVHLQHAIKRQGNDRSSATLTAKPGFSLVATGHKSQGATGCNSQVAICRSFVPAQHQSLGSSGLLVRGRCGGLAQSGVMSRLSDESARHQALVC
jgi:hypothetical protein